MNIVLLVVVLGFSLPGASFCQDTIVGSKFIRVGGATMLLNGPGLSFGSNPIFLVPTDTLGNVSFTGIINGIRVMGKFTPTSFSADAMPVDDPIDGGWHLRIDSIYNVAKHGEWGYYSYEGPAYREYYNRGALIRRDSLKGTFKKAGREIRIVDSMARIRSIVDLYIRKGGE